VIGRLRGVLVDRGSAGGSGGCIVECAGVGYDVTVSAVTHAALPAAEGEVTLAIFTHVQESRIALYGFASAEERQLFDLLITVKNVGPATAIHILSGAPPEALARTIAAGDIPALVRIKGVGKKTAELMVVELKEKCEYLLATWRAAGNPETAPAPSSPGRKEARAQVLDDVASALVNLGWRAAEVDKIVGRMEFEPGMPFDTLLREALRAMPR
jgi:Holliday junction DNA helicase RuvA